MAEDKWKETGKNTVKSTISKIATFGNGPDYHYVTNTETGEHKQVRVGAGEKIGEAIEKGNFVEE